MILGKWPNWRTVLFYIFISILYMFRATPCSSSGESIVSIQRLVYVSLCRWPFGVQVGDLHTKRSPTQIDIYQRLYWYNWFSWWWARDYSKHIENWNKYIEKNCASIWSFTMNHNRMHDQQNIKWSYFVWRHFLYMFLSRIFMCIFQIQWPISAPLNQRKITCLSQWLLLSSTYFFLSLCSPSDVCTTKYR